MKILLPSPPTERPDDREFSELLAKAEAIVVERQRGSISLVQRILQIRYNQAAVLIEALEKKGVLGVSNNGGARTVLKGRGA